MHQRLRCPHCHFWTDALLVWAAGDCCPSCNRPIELARTSPDSRPDGSVREDRPLRGPGRFGQLPAHRAQPYRGARSTR